MAEGMPMREAGSGTADDRPLLSPKRLAERLDVSERQARRLLANEVIPSFKIGGSVKIDPRAVDDYLARLQDNDESEGST